jgi:hypothetical protein
MSGIKKHNRMPAMFGRGGAPGNARYGHEHFLLVDERETARCRERLAALDFSSCTRAVTRIAPRVSCGETRIHRAPTATTWALYAQLMSRTRTSSSCASLSKRGNGAPLARGAMARFRIGIAGLRRGQRRPSRLMRMHPHPCPAHFRQSPDLRKEACNARNSPRRIHR